jgi:hypothetical protein
MSWTRLLLNESSGFAIEGVLGFFNLLRQALCPASSYDVLPAPLVAVLPSCMASATGVRRHCLELYCYPHGRLQ